MDCFALEFTQKWRRYGIVLKYHGIPKYHDIVIIIIITYTFKLLLHLSTPFPTSTTFARTDY